MYGKCMENYEKCMENVEKLREIMENYGKCMENYCLGILYKNLHVFTALLKLYCTKIFMVELCISRKS